MQLRSPTAALLGGGLLVGSIDALYAISFWVPHGATPTRIFQSIAAGLLGRSAFQGGMTTAALGVAFHYFIALAIVVVYWLLSGRFDVLVRRYILCGAVYGLGVYAVMNYVVIPLSANPQSRFNLAWVVWSAIVHTLLIGIPAAARADSAQRVVFVEQVLPDVQHRRDPAQHRLAVVHAVGKVAAACPVFDRPQKLRGGSRLPVIFRQAVVIPALAVVPAPLGIGAECGEKADEGRLVFNFGEKVSERV